MRWGDLSFESGPLSFDWFRQAVEREPESWAAHHAMLEGQVARLRVAAPADCLALLDYAAAAASGGLHRLGGFQMLDPTMRPSTSATSVPPRCSASLFRSVVK